MAERERIRDDYAQGLRIMRRDQTVAVTLLYPPRDEADQPHKPRYVEFDQESVRASDGIRIHYDYHRDGYVIEQASRFAWAGDDAVRDPDWQEVAFVRTWSRAETDEEAMARISKKSARHSAYVLDKEAGRCVPVEGQSNG